MCCNEADSRRLAFATANLVRNAGAGGPMKRVNLLLVVAVATFFAGACKVEKTGENEYKVETPSKEDVREAGTDVKEGAQAVKDSEAVKDIKEGTKEAAADVKEAGRDAASATGRAMEKAGKKIQEKAKPGYQP